MFKALIFYMLTTLDKYIVKQFYKNFFFTIITFLTIFISIDIIEKLDLFIDSEITKQEIIQFYIHTIPSFIHISLPMATLITTIFTFGTLKKYNEFDSIIMSGTSSTRIYSTIFISGIVISFFSFFLEDYIVIDSEKERNRIQIKYSFDKKNKKKIIEPNFFKLPDNKILVIKKYDHNYKRAHKISIQQFEAEKIIDRIDAPEMIFNSESKLWILPTHERRKWQKNKFSYEEIIQDTSINLGVFLSDTLRSQQKPELMNYKQLGLFISDLKKTGNKNPRWDVNHKFRISFSSTSFIMVLFGIGISLNRKNRNIAVNIGIGILSIFAYYVTIKFFQTLGFYGTLHPLTAVWTPNILFLSIGLHLIRKV